MAASARDRTRRWAPSTPGFGSCFPSGRRDAGPAPGLTDAQLRLLALEGVVRLVQEIAATQSRRGDRARRSARGGSRQSRGDPLPRGRGAGDGCPDRRRAASGEAERCPSTSCARLQRDGVADVFDLEPLGRREVDELLGALLDAEPPPSSSTTWSRAPTAFRCSSRRCSTRISGRARCDVGERGARWRGGDDRRLPHGARHGGGPARATREPRHATS